MAFVVRVGSRRLLVHGDHTTRISEGSAENLTKDDKGLLLAGVTSDDFDAIARADDRAADRVRNVRIEGGSASRSSVDSLRSSPVAAALFAFLVAVLAVGVGVGLWVGSQLITAPLEVTSDNVVGVEESDQGEVEQEQQPEG